MHDDDAALPGVGEQFRKPGRDPLGMDVVGAHAENDRVEARQVRSFHVLIGENFHVGADLAQAFRNGVAGARDVANQCRLVRDFRPNEFRLRGRDEGLRFDVRIVDALTAVGLRALCRRTGKRRAALPLLAAAGGVTRKAQFISLPTPVSCTGMDAGSTFQPAGTARARLPLNFSAEAITRRVDRLRLRAAENENRLRQFGQSRRRDDERFAHFARDPIDFAKTRLQRVGDLFLARSEA